MNNIFSDLFGHRFAHAYPKKQKIFIQPDFYNLGYIFLLVYNIMIDW